MKIFDVAAKKLAHYYVNLRLSKNARDVVWVSADGRRTNVEDMEPTHAKHALALIVRRLSENKCAYLNSEGRVTFAELMPNLVEDKVAFQDDQNHIRIQK